MSEKDDSKSQPKRDFKVTTMSFAMCRISLL